MIITIDGPAGTGKTTVARKVALALGFHYFDTGAMYRAITYCVLQKKIDLADENQLQKLLSGFSFDIRTVEDEKQYFIGDHDVTETIRSHEVTQAVSEVSANAKVRSALVEIQRSFGKGKNAVFEGRDMGTVVFPKAELKVYLTARPAVRAERRYLELEQKKILTNEQEVQKEIARRDHLDSTREVSPLQKANDAHLIDTSDLTLEQVVDKVLSLIPRET